MLYAEIIAVSSTKHIKLMNAPCGQNVKVTTGKQVLYVLLGREGLTKQVGSK
jgi:hypothetical protein